MKKNCFSILLILILLFSFLIPFTKLTESKQSAPHVIKGTLYLNNNTAPEGILIKIIFNDAVLTTNTFQVSEGDFNYNFGFYDHENKTGYFVIEYNNESFYPDFNKTITVSLDDDRCYIDLYVNSILFEKDLTSPSKVIGLIVTDAKDGKLNLIWNPATDNFEIDFYEIYREGNLIKKISTTYYQDEDLTNEKTYEYKIRAVDTNNNKGEFSDNVSGTPTKSIPAYTNPTADAGGPYDDVVVNKAIRFSGTVYGGEPPYSYNWDFGDEKTADTKNPKHSYSKSGSYTVTFEVTDKKGNSDIDTFTVKINPKKIPKPKADTGGPYEAFVGEKINFEGAASGGTPPYRSWRWQFGDGNSSFEQSPTHSYSKNGSYKVTFSVTDSKGQIDSKTIYVKIYTRNETKEKDILGQIIEFFGGVGDLIYIEGDLIHFLPIAILGLVLIIVETALVYIIRKKGYFKL